MWPDNRIQEIFNINHPIVQAPMAGSSSLEMAIAVGQAGGLGSLACATLDGPGLRDLLHAAKQAGGMAFNANFFAHVRPVSPPEADQEWLACLDPYFKELDAQPPKNLSEGGITPFDEERCAIVEEFKPAVASFHFGLPDMKIVGRLKAAGIKVMSSATTVAEARWLVERGCDVIIAQGYEAGGHRGMFLSDDITTQIGTFSLVPQIADAVKVPVIAAGGVADGRAIAAALALGASGVQVGTAYLFTEEASLAPLYRETLETSPDYHSALTNVFSGRPARCLVNRTVQELGPMSPHAASFPKGFPALEGIKANAEQDGNRDFSAHYCGQSAALGAPTSTAELTQTLVADAQSRLKYLAR